MYYVSFYDSEGFCLENHCFFDRKTDAINFYNEQLDVHSSGLFISPVKHVEIRHDNVVLDEVTI